MVSQLSKFDEHFVIREVEFDKRPSKKKKKEGGSTFDPNLMNSGMYIATPILLGLLIGYFADKFFNTKPLFILIFIIGGAASAFYNLYKLTKTR